LQGELEEWSSWVAEYGTLLSDLMTDIFEMIDEAPELARSFAALNLTPT
jgi:hypothetical protein